MELNFFVNDKAIKVEISPEEKLASLLRRLGYKSVKIGCNDGNCGACTVIVDGKAVTSCIYFAANCEGSKVYTVESLGSIDEPHPLQKAFVEHGGTQCGFCNPGSLMSLVALLNENPHPSEEEIKEALDGNLCRCTGYVKRLEAVKHFLEEHK